MARIWAGSGSPRTARPIERVYGKSENEGLRKALEGKAVSLAKIGEILKRAEETDAQYVTFWP